MKYRKTVIVIVVFIIGCNSVQLQNRTKEWIYYKNRMDSLLANIKNKNTYKFVEISSGKYKQVFNDSANYDNKLSFIDVVCDSNIKILVETPFSESGDWYNEYIYVFDKSGRLKLLVRKSSFFNSICNDGILTEIEVFSVVSNQLIRKEYQLFDADSTIIMDTSNCVFNYRFDVPVYLDYNELPVVEQFSHILNDLIL